jgi:hypothetical protein
MNLNNGSADDVPTGAGDLSHVAVFVRDGSNRMENQVMDRGQPECSLFIDSGLLGYQFLAADDVGDNTLRHVHRPTP